MVKDLHASVADLPCLLHLCRIKALLAFPGLIFLKDKFAEEGAGGGALDAYGQELSDESGAGGDNDFTVAAVATHEHAFAASGGAFEKDFFDAADEGFVAGEGVFAEDFEEDLVALFFDFGGHGVAERFGGCAGSDAVFEEVGHVEADVFKVAASELEVLFGLTGEAHDDVGRDVDAGADFADAVNDPAEALDGVGAAHGFEDAVAAALHGKMEVFAEFGQAFVALDEVFAESDGVRGGEADAFDTVDVVDLLE